MNLPRLLYITPRFPYPLIGGQPLRAFNLAKQLSKRFDITLVALGTPRSEADTMAVEASGIRELRIVAHSPLSGSLSAMAALPSNRPLNVAFFRSPTLQREVDRLLPRHDVGLFHTIRTSWAWRAQADIPAAIDMCDAIGVNFRQTAACGSLLSPWRVVSAIDAPRTIAFERHDPSRFDLASLHTRTDAERVGIPKERLLISTMGVDVAGFAWASPAERRGRSIALIGKMDFFPNWSGALWFAREVLPLLPTDVRLKLIGLCPPKTHALFAEFPRVDVTGRVDSLEEASRDCFAAIAPMQVATGIQNKVLEYFAMGLPAVVSPFVSLGLCDEAKGAFKAADAPAQWAESLSNILADQDAAVEMARQARRYVEQFHNWDRIGGEYADRLESLLRGRRMR